MAKAASGFAHLTRQIALIAFNSHLGIRQPAECAVLVAEMDKHHDVPEVIKEVTKWAAQDDSFGMTLKNRKRLLLQPQPLKLICISN